MAKKRKQPSPYPLHRNLPAITVPAATSPRVPATHPKIKTDDHAAAFGWKRLLVLLIVTLFALILVIGIWDLHNFSGASNKLFGTGNLFSMLNTGQLGENNGRVNILLVGYSADDPGHAGAQLTDSIMVMSLNKADRSGYMLSVPRDLYVNIPGYGHAKINEAYQAGQLNGFNESGYPSGGMGLLEKVIADNLGIQVQRYAIFDYGAVKEIVDALGGISVTIQSPDPRGIYDPNFKPVEGGPLKLENGTHVIDGQTALRLTRARGSTYGSYGFPLSDFNRTKNQQQVLTAIKSKLNWTLVLNPRKNGQIFNAAADNIKTDIDVSEVLPLYSLFNGVSTANLKPVTLNDVNGVNLLRGYFTPTGEDALIPAAGINNFSRIQEAISQLGL
jgi:polyisoprenyl-teichoic acid--peptidoglycan teichoic acid transferase